MRGTNTLTGLHDAYVLTYTRATILMGCNEIIIKYVAFLYLIYFIDGTRCHSLYWPVRHFVPANSETCACELCVYWIVSGYFM